MAPEGVTPEDITGAAPPSVTVNTEEPVVETHAPAPAATEAPKPITTDPPSVETAAPSTEAEFQSKVTAAAETKMDEEVHKGGLSSGQVVGIVIGALLAVVIVIAVVIATVRRMGKYSP
ncbi:podoplanin isoform X2 [Seriola dumerili]|nr:podoplanin isoform X2 [Seriola dumerili]